MALCDCGRARVGPNTRDQCGVCWMLLNNPRYAARFGGPKPTGPDRWGTCRWLLPGRVPGKPFWNT